MLSLHILRANYQVLIWRNSVFQNPSIQKPEGNGWQINDTNELEVQWYKNDFIPDELNKIVCDEMYPFYDEDIYNDNSIESDVSEDTSEDADDETSDEEDILYTH